MSKIVDQLRDRAYATKAGDPLCDEAARLIEGLEWRSKVHANLIARLSAEVERLRDGAVEGRETVRLTAEEREAIAFGIACVTTDKRAATLRKLLERLHT